MALRTTLIETGSGPLLSPLPFSTGEYARRLEGVRGGMQNADLDFLVSFTPENIYYLTGHDSPGYYYLQACIVALEGPPVMFCRKIESFNTLGRSWSRLVCPYADTQDPVTVLVQLLEELGCAGKNVGIESRAWFVTLEHYDALREQLGKIARVAPTAALVEAERMIKSDEELAYIREGGKICSAAMRAAFAATRAGVRDTEVAVAATTELIGRGSEYAGLPPFIMSGARTALVHSTWCGRTIKSGEVVAYELPAVRNRYCAALFRTGFVGTPPQHVVDGVAAISDANAQLIAAIEPGRTISKIHQISVDVFRAHGIPASPRRSAYALGINYPPDWGEGHIISFHEDEHRPLQPGMVFHVGVGIFDYPRYQLAFTETIIVTENGHECVTDFPHELTLCPA